MFLRALISGVFVLQSISHYCQALGKHAELPHMYMLTYYMNAL